MPRHPRFEDHRYLGDKRVFVVYDCNDNTQYLKIEGVPLESLASFAPDVLSEARNRGYHPVYMSKPEQAAS